MCCRLVLLLTVMAGLGWGCTGTPKVASRTASQADQLRVRDSAVAVQERMIREFLVGKRVESLKWVLGAAAVDSGVLVLVYDGLDCGSCLEAGFAMLNRMEETAGVPCRVVAVNAQVSEVQDRFRYYEFIYTDSTEVLRKELKYVSTPIFLLVDDSMRIADIHKPTDAGLPRAQEFLRRMEGFAGEAVAWQVYFSGTVFKPDCRGLRIF